MVHVVLTQLAYCSGYFLTTVRDSLVETRLDGRIYMAYGLEDKETFHNRIGTVLGRSQLCTRSVR